MTPPGKLTDPQKRMLTEIRSDCNLGQDRRIRSMDLNITAPCICTKSSTPGGSSLVLHNPECPAHLDSGSTLQKMISRIGRDPFEKLMVAREKLADTNRENYAAMKDAIGGYYAALDQFWWTVMDVSQDRRLPS